MRSTVTLGLIALAAIAIVLGCGLGDQTGAANKLVKDANELITAANDGDTKSVPLVKELLGGVIGARHPDEFVSENKSKFDDLVGILDKNQKNLSDAASKMEEASKMKLDDKFKEYLTLKSQEVSKNAETGKLMTEFVRSLMIADDAKQVTSLADNWKSKSENLRKESDELNKKSAQIVKDNPGVINGN